MRCSRMVWPASTAALQSCLTGEAHYKQRQADGCAAAVMCKAWGTFAAVGSLGVLCGCAPNPSASLPPCAPGTSTPASTRAAAPSAARRPSSSPSLSCSPRSAQQQRQQGRPSDASLSACLTRADHHCDWCTGCCFTSFGMLDLRLTRHTASLWLGCMGPTLLAPRMWVAHWPPLPPPAAGGTAAPESEGALLAVRTRCSRCCQAGHTPTGYLRGGGTWLGLAAGGAQLTHASKQHPTASWRLAKTHETGCAREQCARRWCAERGQALSQPVGHAHGLPPQQARPRQQQGKVVAGGPAEACGAAGGAGGGRRRDRSAAGGL